MIRRQHLPTLLMIEQILISVSNLIFPTLLMTLFEFSGTAAD